MEVPNRREAEASFLEELMPLFDEWVLALLRLGFVPWDVYQQRLQQLVRQRTAAIFLYLMLLWGEKNNFSFDFSEAAARAVDWAVNQSNDLAGRLRTDIEQQWRDIVATSDLTPTQREAAIRRLLDRPRAKRLVVTSITAAQTAGQTAAVQEYQQQSGVALTGVWLVSHGPDGMPDSHVCPICRPLDGTTREVWGDRFPLGPPAHPNCRCTLTYQ